MSVHDINFEIVSTGETIYDPLTLHSSTPLQVRVINYGDDDLEDLGFYLVPATNVGEVDNPADYPPHSDYQDMLTWGTATDLGLVIAGGLKITCDNPDGGFSGYFTRTKGAQLGNKIPFINLAAGDSELITLELETPPSVSARRFFIDLKLE